MKLDSPTSRTIYHLRLAPADVLWAVISPFLALWLRDPNLLDFQNFPWDIPQTYQYSLIAIVCALGSFLFFRLNEGISRFLSIHDALLICGAVACAVASSSVIAFTVTRLEGVPRSTPLIYALVLGGGVVFTRLGGRLFHGEGAKYATPKRGLEARRVILVGVDRFAAAAIRLTDCQQPRTTLVVAAVDGRPSTVGKKVSGVKIVGRAEDLNAVIEEYVVHGVAIDEVWLSDGADLSAELVETISAACAARELPFLRLSEALNLVPYTPLHPLTAGVGSQGAVELSDYFELKRLLDIIAAFTLLIALLPVAACVAGLVLMDVGTPALFWQQRIGRHGRKFLLYKFRTYQAPFDRAGKRIPEEQRLSRIGRAIRATRLDEIPQLYNVFVGNMSLIGPRPLLPHDQPSDPRTRLLVRPGITGWAQINGGTIIGAEEKDALDIWYIKHASFTLDLEILMSTVIFALTGEKMRHSVVTDAVHWRESVFSESPPAGQSPPARHVGGLGAREGLYQRSRESLQNRTARKP